MIFLSDIIFSAMAVENGGKAVKTTATWLIDKDNRKRTPT
jgi:hypothetical protein